MKSVGKGKNARYNMILSIIIFPKLQWRSKPTYVVHVDREWKLPNTLGGKHSQNFFFNDKTTLYVRKKSIPNCFLLTFLKFQSNLIGSMNEVHNIQLF